MSKRDEEGVEIYVPTEDPHHYEGKPEQDGPQEDFDE